MVAHPCPPSAWEGEAEGSWHAGDQPGLHSETLFGFAVVLLESRTVAPGLELTM